MVGPLDMSKHQALSQKPCPEWIGLRTGEAAWISMEDTGRLGERRWMKESDGCDGRSGRRLRGQGHHRDLVRGGHRHGF
jgi:hypothetical protein